MFFSHNLTKEEAEQRAIAMIARIQRGELQQASAPSAPLTFKEFLPLYWQTMRVKKHFDLRRPESIIETHLLPRFSDR